MPARDATRSGRANDYSNIGVSGRRTGLVLPQGRLDANGIEEISGIFSSPRKPSPLRKSIHVDGDSAYDKAKTASITPTNVRSTRKSRPARSASPRKSGISGTAKRGKIIDVLHPSHEKENRILSSPVPVEKTVSSPASSAHLATPQRKQFDKITESHLNSRQSVRGLSPLEPLQDQTIEKVTTTRQDERSEVSRSDSPFVSTIAPRLLELHEPIVVNTDGHRNDNALEMGSHDAVEPHFEPLPPVYDDEELDQTFEPSKRTSFSRKEPTAANSRRKRKSDAVEHEVGYDIASSPAAKRAKRISEDGSKKLDNKQTRHADQNNRAIQTTSSTDGSGRRRNAAPQQPEKSQAKISKALQNAVDRVVEKFKVRPGQKKSLYILRREDRSESATQTRSGRVSVKPLAYWRNERCVFGGSPGGSNLEDGARFPLNSIKEIIRTEEIQPKAGNKTKKSKNRKNRKPKAKVHNQSIETSGSNSEDSDQEDEEEVDSDAEPWETEDGTFRGNVSLWDSKTQGTLDVEEEIDIAHAAGAIITKEVSDSSFCYAKLLSTGFFGSGIVELPAGGIKKPKNSRKMHMSFFVATGRVDVSVGPLGGPENKFSIGQGGFWQVPRGNQYSIENRHNQTAKVFFSQACEVVP